MADQLWSPWRMRYIRGHSPGGESECIFCDKIDADDDADAHILTRGETCFVTLNLYPYNNGHMMVVPYQHTGDLAELPPGTLAELMTLTRQGVLVLREAHNPEGFNIGINLGSAAGAGIAEHLHQHIVPRWQGDTNFMTSIGETRVIPEWIDETYAELKRVWDELFPEARAREEHNERAD